MLFIAAFHTPFIQDDIDTLSNHGRVNLLVGHGLFQALKIFFSVARADVVFCWFASVYAFVGVFASIVFGKKSVIVVGGVDVAKEPELEYGIWRSPWRSILVRFALRNATRVLAVDPSLKREAMMRADYTGHNIRVVPTGYDAAMWKPSGKKQKMVLTVAVVHDVQRLKLKGIDLLSAAAKKMPRVKFVIIGVNAAVAKSLAAPSNIEFYETVCRNDLLPKYQRAKVYCQPSRREGLPNTLCEAMLCGCIPVASDVGGIPTAVGNTGLLVGSGDVSALAYGLRRALSMKNDSGLRARRRIARLFTKEKREITLTRLIEELAR